MRLVHEILFSKKLRRPFVAFIQWGRRPEAYRYEVICPWCEKTIGEVREDTDDLGPIEKEVSELAIDFHRIVDEHKIVCTSAMFQLNVMKSTRPLNTEKDRVIM